MSNLRLINETTATNVTTVSITDVFSADFDVYKITLTDYDALTGGANLDYRFINSSGGVVASDYAHGSQIIRSYGTDGDTKSNSETYIAAFAYDDTLQKGNGSVAYVFNPYSSSNYTHVMWENSSPSTVGTVGRKGIAALKQQTTITGIHFFRNGSGNVTLNSVKIYGIKED
jgi:hypothetical protein